MIVHCSGLIGAESGGDDVGFVRGGNVGVGQTGQDGDHLIDGRDWPGAGGLVGVSAVRMAGAPITTVAGAAINTAAAIAKPESLIRFIRGFSVRLQEGEAGRAQEGAADRAKYYRRNRQAVADPVVVRRRPHSRNRTEGR
jgi:hypothetical protein